MNKILDELIKELNETEEVIRFKKLELLVEDNPIYQDKLTRLFDLQKQIVNAKDLGLPKALSSYQKEYRNLLGEWEDDIILSEYYNSLEEVSHILKTITEIIETTIAKKINAE